MNAICTEAPRDSLCHEWAAYARQRDTATREFLIEHYLPLVRATAERIHAKLPGSVELDDLVSVGTFGLMAAVDAFDPARETRFETYGVVRIRGAILDELRSMDWVPRLARRRARALTEATHAMEASLGRSPCDEELSEHMRLSPRELRGLQRDAHSAEVVSLDKSLERESGGQIRAIDGIADQRIEDPTLDGLRKDIRDTVVRNLGKTERLVVLLYYFEEMTMKEIGRTMGLSESRVSQMHSSILAGLREDLEGRATELFAAVSEARTGGS